MMDSTVENTATISVFGVSFPVRNKVTMQYADTLIHVEGGQGEIFLIDTLKQPNLPLPMESAPI